MNAQRGDPPAMEENPNAVSEVEVHPLVAVGVLGLAGFLGLGPYGGLVGATVGGIITPTGLTKLVTGKTITTTACYSQMVTSLRFDVDK